MKLLSGVTQQANELLRRTKTISHNVPKMEDTSKRWGEKVKRSLNEKFGMEFKHSPTWKKIMISA